MKTLFVFASRLENQLSPVPGDSQVLVTGIGKLNASVSLSRAVSEAKFERIINLGICGAAAPGINKMDMFSIKKTIEGDRDFRLKQESLELPELENISLPQAVIVTQDVVITTGVQREQILKLGGSLADMECFALAKTARAFGIPFYSVKIVSDSAGADAVTEALKNVRAASEKLCSHVLKNFA